MIGPSSNFSIDDIGVKTKSGKADKQAVLYLHVVGTDYECKDCIVFIKTNRCLWLGKNDEVLPTDSCGLFVHGEPQEKAEPLGILTPEQVGLTHSKNGFSCKRCEYFNPPERKCEKVDETSLGDDPGIIHKDACCNAWETAGENETTSTDGL